MPNSPPRPPRARAPPAGSLLLAILAVPDRRAERLLRERRPGRPTSPPHRGVATPSEPATRAARPTCAGGRSGRRTGPTRQTRTPPIRSPTSPGPSRRAACSAEHEVRVPGVREGELRRRLRLRRTGRQRRHRGHLQDPDRPPAARVLGVHRLPGPDPADQPAFSPDGRVFVAEKSGLIKVFDSLDDTTPTVVRRPAHGGPQLLGPRAARPGARPGVPGQALRVRPLHLRRGDRRARRRAGESRRVERRLPHPARADDRRLRGQRPALAADGERRHDDRRRAGADQRLVPAVPEPLGRRPRVRRRRRRST